MDNFQLEDIQNWADAISECVTVLTDRGFSYDDAVKIIVGVFRGSLDHHGNG